jgi:hypothetical protein
VPAKAAQARKAKRKAPAGSQPGQAQRNQHRDLSVVLSSADPRTSVPLPLTVEVELAAERDPAWLALIRWLLADDMTHFQGLGASEPEQACTEEAPYGAPSTP